MLRDCAPEVPLSTASAIVPGQILLQKYRVEELLGRGGMGIVFAARHLALDERVAIKLLAPAAADNQDALARLQREARILARVRNEHVVRVIDLGQLDDGSPFMVMEHLIGRDLAGLLEEQGRLAVQPAVHHVLQALVALAAAHANGVVHRDLKPENLFCTRGHDGAWLIKVLDFGISRLERLSPSTSMTGPSAVMGTPLYMSPEQLRDASAVDARSDIWSIGVVLYELVAGRTPFSGASLGDLAIKIATEPSPPLALVDPSLAGLDSVLSRCLHKEREQRFANVAELARALQPFGPAGCERLVERVERLIADPSLEGATPPPALPAARPRQPSRVVLLLAPALLLALGGAWRLMASPGGASPVTSSSAGQLAPHLSAEVRPGAPSIAATVSGPEVPPLADDPPAPPSARDSAKSPPVASSSRSVPVSRASCNPPYTVDLQGRKKFRHECFTERTIR
jgi:eukaryotic-like serine/threonine-protein kinase